MAFIPSEATEGSDLVGGISLAFFPAGHVRFVKGLPFRISSADSAPLG